MWRVIAEPGSPKVILIGHGRRYVFKVIQGRITREVWNAVKAIQQPALRNRIVPGWVVKVPQKHKGYETTGDNRRVALVTPPGKATVELRLVSPHQYIDKHLEAVLRDVIEDRQEPGTREAKMIEGAKKGGRLGSKMRLKNERLRLRRITEEHQNQKELTA